MKKNICVVSTHDDLHAQFIVTLINKRYDASASLVETDRLAAAAPKFRADENGVSLRLDDVFGNTIDVSNIDTVWWRRLASAQAESALRSEHRKLADVSFRSIVDALPAMIAGSRFVSKPAATRSASNKLCQLVTAAKVFDYLPATTICNDLNSVAQHYRRVADNIVKPVENAMAQIVFTETRDLSSFSNDSVSQCPIILQQQIDAARHLRVNVFGDRVFAFSIESSNLDWRSNLNVCDIGEIILDEHLFAQCKKLLMALDLRMGIFDFIESPDGKIFFIEVNPQGQFLFLQPFTKTDLAVEFCDFLVDHEADSPCYGTSIRL